MHDVSERVSDYETYATPRVRPTQALLIAEIRNKHDVGGFCLFRTIKAYYTTVGKLKI